MVIVPVGTVSLQVEAEDSRSEQIEQLLAGINKQVQWIVTRCIEEALAGEVTNLLGRRPC